MLAENLRFVETNPDLIILDNIEKDYCLLSKNNQKKIKPILDKLKEGIKK